MRYVGQPVQNFWKTTTLSTGRLGLWMGLR